jgi:pyruvate/2-oxoglutarate dehydrogenase complex dihydrolipoamide dehydrogenase (E3) component
MRMETSIAGIFAVGDIRAQPVRQVTNTVADGTVAAIMAQNISRSMIRPAISHPPGAHLHTDRQELRALVDLPQ